MARNLIQLHKGLLIPEFNALYATEQKCVTRRLLR